MNSISVFLTTIGRPTLINMLKSLINELEENDFLYIAIDGNEYYDQANEQIIQCINSFKCSIVIFYVNKSLGYWGHGCRNYYQKYLKGDFILHGDDDDAYIKGSFKKIRETIDKSDKQSIIFFKVIGDHKHNDSWWRYPSIEPGNIGTPSGLIPNIPDKMGNWECKYGGDLNFYLSCKFNHIFCEEKIYVVKPLEANYSLN
jgi:hypothetical protein